MKVRCFFRRRGRRFGCNGGRIRLNYSVWRACVDAFAGVRVHGTQEILFIRTGVVTIRRQLVRTVSRHRKARKGLPNRLLTCLKSSSLSSSVSSRSRFAFKTTCASTLFVGALTRRASCSSFVRTERAYSRFYTTQILATPGHPELSRPVASTDCALLLSYSRVLSRRSRSGVGCRRFCCNRESSCVNCGREISGGAKCADKVVLGDRRSMLGRLCSSRMEREG